MARWRDLCDVTIVNMVSMSTLTILTNYIQILFTIADMETTLWQFNRFLLKMVIYS